MPLLKVSVILNDNNSFQVLKSGILRENNLKTFCGTYIHNFMYSHLYNIKASYYIVMGKDFLTIIPEVEGKHSNF